MFTVNIYSIVKNHILEILLTLVDKYVFKFLSILPNFNSFLQIVYQVYHKLKSYIFGNDHDNQAEMSL